MPSVEYDLRYLQEALESLESYLLADELFWNFPVNPPPGEPAYPALTLGGVLLAHARLATLTMDHHEQSRFRSLSIHLEAIKSKWRTAWEQKALRSYQSRLTQWANFMEEYRNDPVAHADRFGYEVRLRLILDLLAQDLPEIPEEQTQMLHSLDLILQQALDKGEFVWQDRYACGFPAHEYWYLYGRLKAKPNPRFSA